MKAEMKGNKVSTYPSETYWNNVYMTGMERTYLTYPGFAETNNANTYSNNGVAQK